MANKSVKMLKDVLTFFVKQRGFDQCLKGVQVIDGGAGKCLCEMNVTEDHLNRGGTLHGGMSATLVDAISTMALMTAGEGSPGVSVDLSVSYMKKCTEGTNILIDAKTQHIGKSLAFLTVDIKKKDCGTLICQGKHTKFVGSK